LGNIGTWGAGATPSRSNPEYYKGNIPWLKTGDLNDGYIIDIPEHISQTALEETSAKLNPSGSVLIAMYGATIGKLGILTYPATTNQACCACISYNGINNLYLFYFLMSQRKEFIDLGVGGAQSNISKEKIINTLIPIPSNKEQNNIVKQIEQYLEYLQNLDLNKNNLQELIKLLKSKILDLAIRGKLVPQDPNDEPADVLLERIRKEKEKLIKQGKIKRDKKESIIFKGDDNSYYEKVYNGGCQNINSKIPFDIPNNWTWVKLGNIFQHNTGKTLNSSDKKGRLYKYITTSNVYWDKIDLNNVKEMYFSIDELEKYTVRKNDLLVCEGGDIGRSAIWDKDYEIRFQNHIHRLRPLVDMSVKFYYYVFYLYKTFGLIGGNGIGIQSLSSNKLDELILPLPPHNEQFKIVKQIEKMILNISQIEKSLS